jgi:hypothetical protein
VTEHFFIVGAQRCGTTYLYHLLDQHPEIEMAHPVRPEPKFFLDDALFARGLEEYHRRFFPGKPGAWLKGEKSTSYLGSDTAAGRIATAFPKAKIVVMLRDPIERALSHWRFSVENGVEPLSVEEAFRREPERRDHFDGERYSTSPFAYLRRGRYIDDLERWTRLFPLDALKVLVTETVVGNREAVADLYRWLGVDPSYEPAGLKRPVNATAREPGPAATLPNGMREDLAEAFAEPSRRLAERFGLDLSAWRLPGRSGGA